MATKQKATQALLARRVGIKPAWMSELLAGKGNATVDVAVALAGEIGTDVSLWGPSGSKEERRQAYERWRQEQEF